MKKIFIAIICILIVGLLVWKSDMAKQPTLTDAELIEKSWSTFESYLAAVQAHDLPQVKALSYQISDACKDSAREAECFKLMDDVYEIGKEYTKDEFKNIYHDKKQVITFTDRHIEETDILGAYARRMIFLTRDNENNLKILFFTLPYQYTYTYKEGRTPEEVLARLNEMIVDTDSDGTDDEVENCVEMDEKCVKTDPTKRDTDGDGWWDTTEALFAPKS